MATTQSILITISQTWTVPTGVTAVWISAIGGGGGGAGGDGGSSGRGAGGNGEFCRNRLIAVSGSLSITIGSGGLGALSPNNGGDGSDTIIVGAFRMAGGWGGTF